MSLKSQRLLSFGLSLFNVSGIVATVAMCIKESKKANEDLAKAKAEGKSTKEKAMIFIKDYKYTLMIGGASILSGIGSRLVGAKTEASLIATAAMLDAGYRKYRGQIKDTLGVDVDKKIRQAVAREEFKEKNVDIPVNDQSVNLSLFYIDKIGYFWADPSEFWKNYHLMYRDLEGRTERYDGGAVLKYYTFRDFLSMVKAQPIKHLSDVELNFGWSYDYLSEEYESCQLDIETEYATTDNGLNCCYITFVQEPIWNPEMWCEHAYGMMSDDEYFQGAGAKVNRKSHLYLKLNNGGKK